MHKETTTTKPKAGFPNTFAGYLEFPLLFHLSFPENYVHNDL